MIFFQRTFAIIFVIAVLLSTNEILAQNDNEVVLSETPSIIGTWRVEKERTNKANADAQKGMSPEKLASIVTLTFKLSEQGKFDQSMGEDYQISGSWNFEHSEPESESSDGSNGRLTFSVENMDDHADMFLDVSFLTPDLLEAKNVLFPAPIYLERVMSTAGSSEGNEQKAEQDQQKERQDRAAEMFADVPGCLGAKSMEQDGTQLSFVWFKDREAVINWCKDQKHMRTAETILRLANPDIKMREPMEASKNVEGPLLVIMTLKRNENGGGFPLEQLSMEIYKPVDGGMFIGDRFAPKELNVNGMREIQTK